MIKKLPIETEYYIFYPEEKRIFSKLKKRNLNPCINACGYPKIKLKEFKGKRNVEITMHRLWGILFLDNPNNLPQINHRSGNKLDFSLDNLEWCTAKHNIQHAWKTGLSTPHYSPGVKGKDNHNAKLTDDQVKEIRYRHKDLGCRKLAKLYNVSKNLILLIRKGKICTHV